MNQMVLIYDIADAARLRKVAKTMEQYGVRVQQSVFEAVLSDAVLHRLRKQIQSIIDDRIDSVVYFRFCDRDWQKRLKLGVGSTAQINDSSYRVL